MRKVRCWRWLFGNKIRISLGQKTRVLNAEDCGGGVTKVRYRSHFDLRILLYLVIYDTVQVSLEHLLLSWYTALEE